MHQWIERLIRRIEYFFDWLEEKLTLASRRAYHPPIDPRDILSQYGADNICAQVLESSKEGWPYAIRTVRKDSQGECISDDVLSVRQAMILLEALQDATYDVSELFGPRRLQFVRLWKARYFVDERLSELRNVRDPADRVLLEPA